MGNLDEIEAALARKREPVAQFEAAAFRASNPSGVRSCLTAHQEALLKSRAHSVIAVFGTEVAGLGEIRESLERLFGREDTVDCSGLMDAASFARKLQDLDKRTKDTHTLILVPSDCPWTEAWLREAARKIEKLTSKSSFVTVLFIGDGTTAWQWAAAGQPIQALGGFGVRVLTLEPWRDTMVRQWLDDCELPSGPEFRDKLKLLTGFWSGLLHQVHSCLRSCLRGAQARESLVDELIAKQGPPSTDSFGFGTNGPLPALRALATLDMPASAEELAEVSEISAQEARLAFGWADVLGIMRPAGGDRWELDPVLSASLRKTAN
jgi:hypothetical protein